MKEGQVHLKTNYQWFSVKLKGGVGWGSARIHLVLLHAFFNDLNEEIQNVLIGLTGHIKLENV